VKKPLTLVYGAGETPPLGVTLACGVQHAALVSIRLLFPLLVAREAGLGPDRVLDVLAISMLVMSLSVYLQTLPSRPVGSGYLCPGSYTSAYVAPSLTAARTGGLGLVLGMTLFGGLIESALSRVIRPLRPFFPPEVAGFVVIVVGVTVGSLGARGLLGIGAPEPATGADLAVGGLSLATMIAFNVWGSGIARVCCALIGMALGYAAAAAGGLLRTADLKTLTDAPFVHVPGLAHPLWTFDTALALPFAVAALAATLRTMGDVTTCQRINDAEWTRPSLTSVSGGVLANGIATSAAGLLGTIGVNLAQSIEVIMDGCAPEGPIEVAASFDEFTLDLRVPYAGAPLELPERRPSNEEILASEEGQRRLAGFMLRRYADQVQTTHRGDRCTVLFHFDH